MSNDLAACLLPQHCFIFATELTTAYAASPVLQLHVQREFCCPGSALLEQALVIFLPDQAFDPNLSALNWGSPTLQ